MIKRKRLENPDEFIDAINKFVFDFYYDEEDERESDELDSRVEGNNTSASGQSSHAEGIGIAVSGDVAHAEGRSTVARGACSHAEGYSTKAIGSYSHSEGHITTANGITSHAEGHCTIADGLYSHTEGDFTRAIGQASHAEGVDTTAFGKASHAEGCNTAARGDAAHAEGIRCIAGGNASHASGLMTIAQSQYQFVVGAYNTLIEGNTSPEIPDINAIFIVGCGNSNNDRANAFRVGQTSVWGGKYNTIGRGYAELFEWEDGNLNGENRNGMFVGIDDGKIHITTDIDDVFGVVSNSFAMCGNVWDDQQESICDTSMMTDLCGKSYFTEWQSVVTVGSVVMCQDGTVIKNGYVMPNGHGIATNSPTKTPYRVLRIIDSTHALIYIK